MRNCVVCGEQTSGSTGAAGIKWPMICQLCKDKEDSVLAAKIKIANEAIKAVLPVPAA